MQRPGVCDDDERHAASKAEAIKRLLLPFEIRQRIGFVNLVRLEKAVDCVEAIKPEHAAHLVRADATGAVGFGGQRFERLALHIAAGAEPFGEIVGYVEDEIHGLILPRGWVRKASFDIR